MVKAFRKALIVKVRTSIALVLISLIASFGLNAQMSESFVFFNDTIQEVLDLEEVEIEVNHFYKARVLKSMAALSYVEGLDVVADTTTLHFVHTLILNASLSYEIDYIVCMEDFFAMLNLTQTPTFEVLSLSFGFAVGDIGKI